MEVKMIFYFSGTGNSLYAARKLAESLGETNVYSMKNYHITQEQVGENEKIGFVFPSYYGNLPRLVHKFIDEINIHPNAWVYAVATMGGKFGRGCFAVLDKQLAQKEVELRYGNSVTMTANYIANYNPFGKTMKSNAKADKQLILIADDIRNKKTGIKKNNITSDSLYKNIELLDEKFYTEASCSGCGQCEKICPVNNIKLVDNAPAWQHHCEHCMACIHWCPHKAIQYGKKTSKRRRYQNPDVNIGDMV
jgi:ferredoxin